MNKYGKKILGVLMLLIVAVPSFSKDGRIKMSPLCEYKGNVENKVADGEGVLYISNPLVKDTKDIISGTFIASDGGYSVNGASIEFYSGWSYFGGVQISVNKGDSQQSSVRISLFDGEMSSPEIREKFKVDKDTVVFWRCYDKPQKEYSLNNLVLSGEKAFYTNKPYSKYTKCDSIICKFSLPVTEVNGKWEYEYRPEITDHLEYTNGCVCDTQGAHWSCTTPLGDTVSFKKGHRQIVRRQTDTYLCYVENGTSVYESSTFGHFMGKMELEESLDHFLSSPFSLTGIKMVEGVRDFPDSSKLEYRNGQIVGITKTFSDGKLVSDSASRIIMSIKEGGTGFSGLVSLNESMDAIVAKSSVSDVHFSPVDGSMRFSNGDILYYSSREVTGFYKRFKEALMEIREGKGMINYLDGGCYKGTMKVWTKVTDKSLAEWGSINDISIEYIDGEEVHPNGTSDIWKNSLTEYLKNKEAGNYAKFQSAMDNLNRDKVAALAKQWDDARPSLEAEWGSRTVNAFYEGRFILGIPRGFVERLKELHLPLMRVVGPMEIDGIYNDYIVILVDRIDGQSKVSYILRFGGLFDELLSINQ